MLSAESEHEECQEVTNTKSKSKQRPSLPPPPHSLHPDAWEFNSRLPSPSKKLDPNLFFCVCPFFRCSMFLFYSHLCFFYHVCLFNFLMFFTFPMFCDLLVGWWLLRSHNLGFGRSCIIRTGVGGFVSEWQPAARVSALPLGPVLQLVGGKRVSGKIPRRMAPYQIVRLLF